MRNPYRDYHVEGVESSRSSARAIVPIVMRILNPGTVVDVGCGAGAWLEIFGEHGVSDVLGVDGDYVDRSRLRIPRDKFVAADLARGFSIDRRFDLAVSLEVGEHLPEAAAPQFVRSLVDLAPAVLYSAAIPGQGGIAHTNEQWPAFWGNLFARHAYRPVDAIRDEVWEDESVDWWYRQNVLLYLSEDLYAALGDGCSERALRPIVHPALFNGARAASESNLTVREAFRELPRVLKASARYRVARRRR